MQPWYALATWVGQIMPLFFVIGGFAGLTAWRSLQRRGGDASGYVKSRVLRLARPAFPLFVFYIVAIGVGLIIIMTTGLSGSGCSTASSSEPARRSGSSPRTRSVRRSCRSSRACTRSRRSAPCWCCSSGVIVVDVLRYATADLGMISFWLGLLNLLFVWPLIQQIGFWYADGFFDRPWWQLVLISLAALGMLWPLTTFGPYASTCSSTRTRRPCRSCSSACRRRRSCAC